jgi:ubiquinone/menaquinone biosynthesis C-methylase UbiE
MSDLYSSAAMAAGYAQWRPPVHPRVMQRVRDHLQLRAKVTRALDVGCGAGLSAAALEPVAQIRVGIEPVEAMLKHASAVAPRSHAVVSRAEQLPFAHQSFQLLAAAGSLNYVDLDAFFHEARRVMAAGGHLIVYDFGPGRTFADSPELDEWYAEFELRYPFPPATRIEPETLSADPHALRREGFEKFETALSLTAEFYTEYALTETSVSAAIGRGVPESEIRDWCRTTLPQVFGGRPREVVFRGYIVYLRAV